MRRRLLLTIDDLIFYGTEIVKSTALVGDIVFYDKKEDTLVVIRLSGSTEFPIKRYTPIGVIGIAAQYLALGTNVPLVLGLKELTESRGCAYAPASCNSKQYEGIIHLGLCPNPPESDILGYDAHTVIFPVINGGGYNYPLYTSLSYRDIEFNTHFYGISPYLEDNETKKETEFYSNNTACADFNSAENKRNLLLARGTKDYNTWFPKFDDPNDYPAISLCDMYKTPGTNQGDWNLPSLGEAICIISKYKYIYERLLELSFYYPNCFDYTPGYTSQNLSLITSTEYITDLKFFNCFAFCNLDEGWALVLQSLSDSYALVPVMYLE